MAVTTLVFRCRDCKRRHDYTSNDVMPIPGIEARARADGWVTRLSGKGIVRVCPECKGRE